MDEHVRRIRLLDGVDLADLEKYDVNEDRHLHATVRNRQSETGLDKKRSWIAPDFLERSLTKLQLQLDNEVSCATSTMVTAPVGERLQAGTEDVPVLDRPALLRRRHDSGAGYTYVNIQTCLLTYLLTSTICSRDSVFIFFLGGGSGDNFAANSFSHVTHVIIIIIIYYFAQQ